MIDNWPILSIVTFLPLAGVLFLLLIKGDETTVAQNSRHVALWVSGFTFLVSLALLIGFDSAEAGYQFEEKKYHEISDILGTSVGALKASYHHAVKKIELFLTKD